MGFTKLYQYGIIKTVNKGGLSEMYVCDICGYVYDPAVGCPEQGIAPGTAWEDVPEDFVCPTCGVGKDMFSEE